MKRILTIAAVLLALGLVGCQELTPDAIVGVKTDPGGFHYDSATGYISINGKTAKSEQVAHWLIAEKPEISGLEELEMLPDSIHLQILKAGMIELGVNPDTAQQVVSTINLDEANRVPAMAATASCQQFIEYEPCAGATGNRGWWTDPYCDGDPSDNEYIFAYYPTWSDTPDDVRWYTYNAYVYYALWVAYRANLLARDACYPGIYLCVGDRGTWLAGGPVVVSLYVLVAHR